MKGRVKESRKTIGNKCLAIGELENL